MTTGKDYNFTSAGLCQLILDQNCNGIVHFYMHGYDENRTDESVQTILNAYKTARPNDCFILLDYSANVKKTNEIQTIYGYATAVVNGVAVKSFSRFVSGKLKASTILIIFNNDFDSDIDWKAARTNFVRSNT